MMPEGDGEAGLAARSAGGGSGHTHHSPVDLPVILGRNLKRLRTRQGHSLDRLAQLSGVSRAMIGQIETAKSVPTIGLMWRLAKALDVEFANLLATQDVRGPVVLRGERARIIEVSGGKLTARPLFPLGESRTVEFHEVRIARLHAEEFDAHAPGTRKSLIVTRGTIAVATGSGSEETLKEGDAIRFDADRPHTFQNIGETQAVLYLVTTYVEPVG
jgi:transcriptional regulator with XRE-family HTH domain